LNVICLLLIGKVERESERRGIGLTRADANRMVEVDDEDLAVADLSGFGLPT